MNRIFGSGRWRIAAVLLFFSLSVMGGHLHADDREETRRPKIGLVLSGGGARGAAHIGVIKVLEEMRVPIDYIAGTSMGSIVGGLYASGMTSEEIENTVTGLDWAEAFKDLIPREDRSFRRKSDDRTYLIKQKPGLSDDLEIKLPPGLLQGQRIEIILKRLALPVSSVHDFDDYRIPFRAVATDIVTGKAVVLGSGDLATAMRASMSVPGAFSPVEIDGKLLVDGGVSDNLPVNVVRQMGADIIIAVDISTPLRERDELASALKITAQLTGILTRRNTEEQIALLTEDDVFIVPDLGDITSAAFDRAEEAIPIGFAAAEEKRQELSSFSLSETAYASYRDAQAGGLQKRDALPPVISFIRLENNSRVSDKVLLARIQVETGQALDVEKLEKDIGEIYGLELFEKINYEVLEENGEKGLLIHVNERSWGPNYIQAGIAMSGGADSDSGYNLSLAYTRTAINRLNGEWRSAVQFGESRFIFTELYQPLDVNSRYFINPQLYRGKNNVNIYSSEGDRLAIYQVTQYGVDLAAGRELGAWGEVRTGIRRFKGDMTTKVGISDLPDYDFDSGELYLKVTVDKLDDLDFPREGYAGFVEYISSMDELGADSSFDQVLFDAGMAKSWGRDTLLAGGRLYSTLDSNAPIQNRFQLGGLFNLPGFSDNELSGQHLGLLRFVYMRRIGDFNLMPSYIGASLEYGNVWQDKDDIDFDSLIPSGSVFIGMDTFFGPVYIGYGQAEGDNSSFYFYLSKLFNQ